jgi:DNA modification methylase
MEVKRQARQERQVVQVGSIHEKLSGDCCHTCHTCLFFLYNFYNTPSFPMENTHFGGDLAGNGKPIHIGINKNNHPIVKPIKLMEYLIKLVTPKGGTVLDCFLGSGTTGVACAKLGFKFIGIEKESEYVKIAEARIKPHLQQEKLI